MKIPVIRGQIGDWRYYTGVMSFGQIAKKVEPSVEQFYSPSCLSDLLQRELTDNYLSIKQYLLKEDQRFFNAIVLAIYDGDPKWLEVEFGGVYETYNDIGFLELDEKVKIFPVDGQHRVKGIIEALKENEELEKEQVPVVFIAHRNTIEGKKRTRKLFSTLNRRAQPVGENYQIALDEDDIVSIITRELVENFSLFQQERMCNVKSKLKQIPSNNTKAFTSFIAFYQCNNFLVQSKMGIVATAFKKYKLFRPDESIIQDMTQYVSSYWEAFCENIDVIRKYLNNHIIDAEPYRNANGGNILFRPIGIIEFVKASVFISSKRKETFDKTLKSMNRIEMNLESVPWKGVVWNGTNIINRVNLNLIRLLIMYMEDKDNLSENDIEKLIDLYIAATNFDGERNKISEYFEQL